MKRASPAADLRDTSMPVSTSSPQLAAFPSFASVFGNGSDLQTGTAIHQPSNKTSSIERRIAASSHVSSSIIRRDSASTFDSNNSSPTTTISTIDSSLTEPSPSSSPESPTSVIPHPSSKYSRISSVQSLATMDGKDHFSNSFPVLPGIDRSDSPNKKMRNMKNLSVNTTASNRPSLSQLPKLGMAGAAPSLSGHAFSAPPTPAFIVPPKAPRRKASKLGLTLTTPDSNASGPQSQDRPGVVPQTPSDNQIQTLRLLQTSSSGSLFSPNLAPEGGMRLPPFNNTSSSSHFGKSGPPLSISPNSLSSPIQKQTLEHVQEETDYEVPLSQEAKSPAYPQGPVCIYDPYVYLYLEPSHVEAREFDVIMNVAREVQNPFSCKEKEMTNGHTTDKGIQVSVQTADKGVQVSMDTSGTDFAGQTDITDLQKAASQSSLRLAQETQIQDASPTAPSTPKAARSDPEYIHIPWDHNTSVVDDLLRLCELIDDRVRQRKRILVHCQCGVSRSASLVVAYGIYKNPQLTVQEAYDAVKNRSRWIGPNMNLIYQLSEFKSKLAKSALTGTHAWRSWRAVGSDRTNLSSKLTPEVRSGFQPNPLQSPLQSSTNVTQEQRLSSSAPTNTYNPPGSAQLTATSKIGDITPGPLSAPPNYQWSSETSAVAAGEAAKIVDGNVASKDALLPGLMDVEREPALTPNANQQEAIQQKEDAPAGAVANDLQGVAKDLDDGGLSTTAAALPQEMDLDTDDRMPAPPGTWPADDIQPPNLASKPSISDLPIGFSSLLNRRQGLKHLPVRQENPRLVGSQIVPRNFDPIINDDVPPTPSLLSPRASEFTASPFHRTAAGDLAGSSLFEQSLMSPKAVAEDPRSPPQRGEAPITRNIFDMI
ncbi:MAG: hypothetical protein Q9164_001916 [Protoblastenia rupestris]